MRCILCGHPGSRHFAAVWGQRYLRCSRCGLTFVHPGDRPNHEEERARYETHENDPDDPRYRAFLDRLAQPLMERLTPGMVGLDYGSGPGPTLSRMLTERGYPTADYDPFFAPAHDRLEQTFDFVTCSETVEHFHHPAQEFERLAGMVRRPGWLAVMTQLLDDDVDFMTWWYIRDPTHVTLYRHETLQWIARHHGWSLERPSPSVALFHNPVDRRKGPRRGSTTR